MSEPSDDHTEERLRSILRAEADSVKPSPEALNLIRARTERNRFAFSWLRPLLAVGAAAAIAGSVLVAAPQVREQVLPELFPASSTEQRTQSDEPDESGQAARETEPAPNETGATEVEPPPNGGTPPPEAGGEPPEAGESPEVADRTPACSDLPSEPQDPTITADGNDEESGERECESEDDGSGEDTGGSDDDGSDDDTGGSDDDGSGEDTGGSDPSAGPEE